MSEELDPQMDGPSPEMQSDQGHEEGTRITRVSGMYEDYFLDYASYVIRCNRDFAISTWLSFSLRRSSRFSI